MNRNHIHIWHAHYKPKPAHDHIPDWQTYLEWYRQNVTEVLAIEEETGWGAGDTWQSSAEEAGLSNAL